MTLDELLRYEEDEPAPHRVDRPPSRYRWLIRPLVISVVGAVAGWLMLRAVGLAVPPPLIFMILLINKKDLMGEWTNSGWVNAVSWFTVVFMIGLTLAYMGISIRGL